MNYIDVLPWLGFSITFFGYIGWGHYRTKVQIRKNKEHELYAKSIHSDKFGSDVKTIKVYNRWTLNEFDFRHNYKSVAVSTKTLGRGFDITTRLEVTYFLNDESYVHRVFLLTGLALVMHSWMRVVKDFSPQAHVEPYLVHDLT